MSFSESASPFAEKLGTNYIPSDMEIKDIRALLISPTEQIAQIEGQIEEMDVTIRELKVKRSALLAAIDAHRALISPMRHAPDDILREIFLACLPTDHNALIDPIEAPILFGRVCRHWRAVAHSTPMLWSSVHIPAITEDARAYIGPKLEAAIKVWFERSDPCPLTVSLLCRVDCRPDRYDHPVFLLLDVAHRLQHLVVIGQAADLLPILCLGPESLPLLKSIRLMDTAQGFTDHPDATNALQIPTLRDVSLYLSTDPLALPLNWAQLTAIKLVCSTFSTQHGGYKGGLDGLGALEVLRRCPNLLRCELRNTKNPDEDSSLTANTYPLALPHLHTLILRSFVFPTWIPHLSVPNLRHLELRAGATPSTEVSLIQRTHCSMSANIDPYLFTRPALVELLRAFPAISHLHLSTNAMYHSSPLPTTDAFLAHFGPPHNLSPWLTHFTCVDVAAFSDVALLGFITARMGGPGTPSSSPAGTRLLQHVEVSFLRRMTKDVRPQLRKFVEEDGLRLELRHLHRERALWTYDPRGGLEYDYLQNLS
jgi:hypothetical protein